MKNRQKCFPLLKRLQKESEGKKVIEMYSLRETAKKSGLSVYYLRKLLAEGKIKYLMCGRKFLINYASVIDLCNGIDADQKV